MSLAEINGLCHWHSDVLTFYQLHGGQRVEKRYLLCHPDFLQTIQLSHLIEQFLTIISQAAPQFLKSPPILCRSHREINSIFNRLLIPLMINFIVLANLSYCLLLVQIILFDFTFSCALPISIECFHVIITCSVIITYNSRHK